MTRLFALGAACLLCASGCGRVGFATDRMRDAAAALADDAHDRWFGVHDLGLASDGVFTANTPALINDYAPLARPAEAGATTLELRTTAGFASGDAVLVWQTTRAIGAAIGDSAPVIDDRIGRWELSRVATVGRSGVELARPLLYAYEAPGAQLVRVPEYSDVRVGPAGRLLAQPWDGERGGIVAFLATGRVVIDGAIDADGAGLRGGAPRGAPTRAGCSGLEEPSPDGGYRGESWDVGRYGVDASGRGNLLNGGGGGVCNRSGGGGGGAAGAGGRGGSTDNFDSIRPVGGLGGAAASFLLDRLLLGGGGGAGHAADVRGGGAGGGAIVVRADRIEIGGEIRAVGESGDRGERYTAQGASGGGGGGSIRLFAGSSMSCGPLLAVGGRGGHSAAFDDHPYGPGGGGGGGAIVLEGAARQCEGDVSGGSNGQLTTRDGADPPQAYGAQAGESGVQRR